MRKLLIIILLLGIIVIIGCATQILEVEISELEEELQEIEHVGPGGCKGEECDRYCRINPQECKEWCEENPDLCSKMLEEEDHGSFPSGFGMSPGECQINPQKCLEFCEKNPGICPEEHTGIPPGANIIDMTRLFISGGPGGCKGAECEQFCQQNQEECAEWCQENPDLCSTMMGGATKIVNPPNTVITFAKTVNLIAELFTEEDIIKAKELGANMATFWPVRMIQNDEIIFFPEVGGLSRMINTAHQNGLQVELRNSYASGSEAKDYDKFRANAMEHIVEFAKYAEQHKVYRIVPFGEVDNNMVNHCDKITELSQELLQEMRKHYSGQIGTGVIAPWRDCGFTFEGYDYLTFSPYAQTQIGMDKWLTPNPDVPYILENNNLMLITKWIREVADRSGVSAIHIGETGVINPGEEDQSDFNTVVVSKEKEAEFYDMKNIKKPRLFLFQNYKNKKRIHF